MAWAEKARSGRWTGRFRDVNGVARSAGTFAHKAAALRSAFEAEDADRVRAAQAAPDPSKIPTWGEWSTIWLSRRNVSTSTSKTDNGRVKNYLLPKWGSTRVADISRGAIRSWVQELKEPKDGVRLSDSTVQRIVHLLSSSLDYAMEDSLVSSNPARGLKLRPADNSREVFLTPEQFWSIYDSIDENYRTAVHLLAFTGMRLGEAIGLHKARIHEGTGLIEIRETWDDKNRLVKPYPKGKSRRFVAMPEWVPGETPASRRGEKCGQEHVEGRCPGSLFLHSPEGVIMDPSRLRKAFERACSANGLEGVRLHDLRHTYASWLIQDGVSLAEVGRALGHKSPQTTARYAHLAETPKEKILAALPSRSATPEAGSPLRLVK